MPNVRNLQRSFAGGEMSPEMYGRIDDQKFQTGAATVRNFVCRPQGPAENRAGFAYVREVKDSTKKTRLQPFTYSTTQTMVLELGNGYIRFHTQGATLLQVSPAAWSSATAYTVGSLVSRSGVNYYCIAAHTNQVPPNATYWYAEPLTGEYEIPTPYATADLFDIHHVQSADVLTIVHPSYAPRELRRNGATNWTLVPITFSATITTPTGVTATSTGASSVKYTYKYVVTAIASDLVSESAASAVASIGSNLFETGCINTISWSAVSGASRYNVYKYQGGIYGYIGQTDSLSLIDDNITPDLGTTPPTYESVFNSSNNYPGAVSYFEQRRAFAGTVNDPQKIWMTKSGTESNMSYSLPIKDDDRIAFRVAAREANTIRHIVPLTQLILLTSSAEWRVTSVNSDEITPTTISVRPQSYIGASNVQPSIINNTLVYVAARGGHVRELGYSWQSSGFITGDLSVRAAHLFDNKTILDQTYLKAPNPLIYFVNSTGMLLGLTYIPEQQVGAWHHHDTDGMFEACTSVAEGDEDALYVIVNRTINGTTKRYVERQQTRSFPDLDNAFFVDSGLKYDGTNTSATTVTVTGGTVWDSTELLTVTASTAIFAYPATTDVNDAIVLTDSSGNKYRLTIKSTTSTTVAQARLDKTLPVTLRSTATTVWSFARDAVAGLTHLEGKTVSILADGAVQPRQVVTSGRVSIPRAASIIIVGLPYNSDLKTLPLALGVDAGFGQGRFKNVNKAWLRVYKSSGIFVGPDEENLTEAKQRTTEPYGVPPELKSQEILVVLTPTWADSGSVFVRQSDPLPLTIVGMTLEVSVGG